jgi:hypothetical protein
VTDLSLTGCHPEISSRPIILARRIEGNRITALHLSEPVSDLRLTIHHLWNST